MTEKQDPQQGSPLRPLRPALPYVVAMLVLLALVYSLVLRPTGVDISYSEFKQLAGRGQVAEVVLRDSEIRGRLREAQPLGTEGNKSPWFFTRAPALISTGLPGHWKKKNISTARASRPCLVRGNSLLRRRRNELLCVSSRPA